MSDDCDDCAEKKCDDGQTRCVHYVPHLLDDDEAAPSDDMPYPPGHELDVCSVPVPMDPTTPTDGVDTTEMRRLSVCHDCTGLTKPSCHDVSKGLLDTANDLDESRRRVGVLRETNCKITKQFTSKQMERLGELTAAREEIKYLKENCDDCAHRADRNESDLRSKLEALEFVDAKLTDMTKNRDGWEYTHKMYAEAWNRELKLRRPKVHLIDELVLGTRDLYKRIEEAEAKLAEVYEEGVENGYELHILDGDGNYPGAKDREDWEAQRIEIALKSIDSDERGG